MMTIRRAGERGRSRTDWLDSRHTFSFADYHDPAHMGFGPLRVINEDRVRPGTGFPTHGHRDMEILSYVLEGALAHQDSIGNGSTIRPGEVQRMTAGTGIRHSEFNGSETEPVHFLQIWILPERAGLAPGYEQKAFPPAARRGAFGLVGSRDGRDGSVTIHQDVDLYAALLAAGQTATHRLAAGRKAWLQVARGTVAVDGASLEAGDGAAVADDPEIEITARTDAELLLFDMG